MLSVLYAAIAAELLAINAYAVPLVGEEHVRRHDAPPRLIFIPDGIDPSPVEGPGGNPITILNSMRSTEVVIHAPDYETAEGMYDQAVISIHKTLKGANAGKSGRGGRFVITKAKFTRGTLIGRNGVELRFFFSVAAPIVKRTWPTPDPGESPQKPDASTYTGDQANTYVNQGGVTIAADVGVSDADPDNVTIEIEE